MINNASSLAYFILSQDNHIKDNLSLKMKQHSEGFLKVANHAKEQVDEISFEELQILLKSNTPPALIDVREDHEWDEGALEGAIHLSRGILERDIEKKFPQYDTPIVVYCSGGYRSAMAAYSLKMMGYTHVKSLAGGLSKIVHSE